MALIMVNFLPLRGLRPELPKQNNGPSTLNSVVR